MPLTLDDEPDLVVMSVYITSAKRAYEIADRYRRRGSHVALGGLHVRRCRTRPRAHADTVFIGPGEDTWPTFLADLRRGEPAAATSRSAHPRRAPPLRRDLIDRRRYLCPNSIVVSRGCPHHCDFCYKDAFYEGGISFYTQAVDRALAEIDRMPGRHVYFLDDHLLGNPRFATALFDGHARDGPRVPGREHGRRRPPARICSSAPPRPGMRSVFVGLETINPENLALHAKRQNVARDYEDGDPPGPRPRDHGQRELRVRARRRRPGRLRPDRGLGRVAEHRDRDLPHHDPVPGHGPPRPGRGRGPDHRHRLGPLRHAPRRLPAAAA